MLKPIPRSEPVRIEGSFRDPAGQIFQKDGHIYRTINACSAEDFAFVQRTNFYRQAVSEKHLIAAEQVPLHILNGHRAEVSSVIEHPRLPFVSYPYEWTFRMLKTAALFHLDFHSDALTEGITLVDASAYNVQFIGASPIFIDILSLRRYEPGSLWSGYKQFCDQFLNPLLLQSCVGLPHNAWYRGSQEGITADEIRKLLPVQRKLSRRILTHVILRDSLQKTTSQGWAQRERYGLRERASADGVIALALIHHMSIGGNVPLAAAVAWLVGLAPRGVIEFVPKKDPMFQELLRFREAVFPNYTQENFLRELQTLASVERRETSSSTGRLLVEFLRSPQD